MAAFEEGLVTRTITAGADLTGKQYYAVLAAGTLCGDDGEFYGILQNVADASGKPVTVAVGGISRCVFGGTVAAGALVNVDSNGKIVTIATGDNHAVGICRVGGDSGEIGCIEIRPQSVAGRSNLA